MMEPAAVPGPVVATDLKTSIAGLRSGTVTEIRLVGSVFDENVVIKQMQEFAEALGKNKSLTALYFDCWIGGDKGAKILATGLEKNESLKGLAIQDTELLRLNSSRIRDAGASALAKALKNNFLLTDLSVNYNAIGNAGVEELLSALVNSKTLKTLDLGNNSFDNSTTDDFVYFLENNQSIERLVLDNNKVIEKIFIKEIFSVLAGKNRTLKILSLIGNGLTVSTIEIMNLFLQSNESLIEISFNLSPLGEGRKNKKEIEKKLLENKLKSTAESRFVLPQKESSKDEVALKSLQEVGSQSEKLKKNPEEIVESLLLQAKFDEALKYIEETRKFIKDDAASFNALMLMKSHALILKGEKQTAIQCFSEMDFDKLEDSPLLLEFVHHYKHFAVVSSDSLSGDVEDLALIKNFFDQVEEVQRTQETPGLIRFYSLAVKFFLEMKSYPEAKKTLSKLLSIDVSIPLIQYMLKEFSSLIGEKLSEAVEVNNLEEVKKLSVLIFPNQPFPSALHLAIERQNMSMLLALLNLKNVKLLSDLGFLNLEDLDLAVDLDDDHNLIVDEKLLDLLDVNIRDVSGQTPLHYTVVNNAEEVVQMLLKKGADINAADLKGNTPLHLAILINSPILTLLLKLGADTNRQTVDGNTALHLAIRKRLPAKIVKDLIDRGASRITKNAAGKIPLHYMGENGQIDVLKLLLQKLSINTQDLAGNTPLHCVIQDGGSPEMIEMFLKNGADVNQKNFNGDTPLHIALSQQRNELVGSLLNCGAKLHVLNENNETPFHLAAKVTDVNVINLLITQASKENNLYSFQEVKNKEGFTALQIAVICRNLPFIKALVNSVKKDAKQNVGSLINFKSSKASGEQTTLHLAVSCGDFDTVKFLVESGADCWLRDGNNGTPLACATYLAKKEIKVFLRKHQIQVMNELITKIFTQQWERQLPPKILLENLTIVLQQHYLKTWIKESQGKEFAIALGKHIASTVITAMKFIKDSNSLAAMVQGNNHEQIQQTLKAIVDEAYQKTKKPVQKSSSFMELVQSSEIEIEVNQKGLYISQSKLYELKRKAFFRAIKEGIRYLFYVNLALVNNEVRRAEDGLETARTLFTTLSPSISAAVCEISQNEKNSFKVGLAFSLVNILFQAITKLKDREARERANHLVETFQDEGDPNSINIDAITAVAQMLFDRFKDQIMQFSVSIGTDGTLHSHQADGVVQFARVIVKRIGVHILNDKNKYVTDINIRFIQAISSVKTSIQRSLIKFFGQVQNIKAREPVPLVQRCLIATWDEDIDVDMSIQLEKKQHGKALTWQAHDILCHTGIRLIDNPEQCYFRQGYFEEEIGFCFASKEEIDLRKYQPYKQLSLEPIEPRGADRINELLSLSKSFK